MTDPDLLLGIDVGGTGIRLALAPARLPDDRTDHLDAALRTVRIPAPARITAGGLDAAALLDGLLPALAELLPSGARVGTVAVGATGMAMLGRELAAALPAPLIRATGARHLVLASDAVTAYAGALGSHPGVVVAAGTGVVALGLHPAPSGDRNGEHEAAGRHVPQRTGHAPQARPRPGERPEREAERPAERQAVPATPGATWRRADGWGQLLGDCGGGSWLGRAALEAALRAVDGRPGGSVALLTLAQDRYGPAAGLPAALQTRADRAGLLAAFAPDVATAAADGCPIADGLLRRAGEEIAATATAAATGLVTARLALTGGLFNLAALRAATLAALPPHLHPQAPDGPPLLGALRLAATAAADSPWPADPPLLDFRTL
ncbi:BadF/BadG/BcrA/BcrD ATPase family protein [Kitasatospora sp. NPDC096147]|uniref:BadF/BadG/BcrA/BcrD ATPase family protein n=1 Tax=Kitasatospora sp. NPDC096147 TaxID=3364093 RepID=UPI0038184193